jgi:protein SCO1/2
VPQTDGMRRFGAVVVVLALLALGVAGCTSNSGEPTAKSSGLLPNTGGGIYEGMGVVPARPRPSFTLNTTAGKPFNFGAGTTGTATLLYFGYTNCPDVCPVTMADIGEALQSLPRATQQKVDVVFVSTDVKHDTGPIIAEWLHNFVFGTRAHFIGLRGTQAQVNAAQASAHVFLAEDDGATHSAQVLLYGADNYARDSFVYDGAQEQKQIEHDLPLVVGH